MIDFMEVYDKETKKKCLKLRYLFNDYENKHGAHSSILPQKERREEWSKFLYANETNQKIIDICIEEFIPETFKKEA